MMMELERFAALADAYGGDLSRWPADQRAAAMQCLAQHPQAATILAQAQALDDALNALPAPAAPSELLARRLLKAAPTKTATRTFGAPIWATMAASMVIGVLVGFGGVQVWDRQAAIDTALSQSLDGEDSSWKGVDG
jgi:ferric-dicitrate binding protein FerR (iron transport regulator)